MGIGLCEAHAVESMVRRTLPPGSQFAHPAMTLFLQKFVGYMMAFGISYDQGRNSVWSTLRKHEATLTTTGKAAYSKLLLQAYETTAAPAPQPTSTAAVASAAQGEHAAASAGNNTDGCVDAGSTGGSGSVDPRTPASDVGGTISMATEEEFEGVALGLVGPVGSDASAAEVPAEGVLSGNKHSIEDVFG